MSNSYMILSFFLIVNCLALATANDVATATKSYSAVSDSEEDGYDVASSVENSGESASSENDDDGLPSNNCGSLQPQTCLDPNEEFVQEKLTCPPDTCESLVSKFNCSNAPPPQPGCVCKSGYLRLNTNCIPVRQCPQMASPPDFQTCKDPNEEFVQEKLTCPPDTCNALVARIDCSNAPPPQPGCMCQSGYRRLDKTMVCVPLCDCPEMASAPACQKRTCKDPNEEFVQEKSTCPPDTCISLVTRYDCSKAPPPLPGCVCKSGYKRLNESSKCVPICECPELASSPDCQPQTCKDPNEEFVQEKPSCPPDTCNALVAKYDCSKAPPPQPGCVCKSGYRRLNESSSCVPICECPEMASSPDCPKQTCNDPNEEFVQKKKSCPPDTCISLVARYDCSKAPPPTPGCVCKSGYKRLNKLSKCVPICKCPQLASSPDCVPKTCKDPNEEFVQEKPSCPPDTCISLVARYDCSKAPPPKPGCICKSGYKRLNESSNCVPICECPQLASSPDCQPQTCKDPNEEYVLEKPSCPPDTCSSLVARYNCSNAPPPQPGCVCKSGYRRLDKTSKCVPICKCPEMASSAECQQKPHKEPQKLRCGPNEVVSCVSKCPPEKTCKNRHLNFACPLSIQPCTEKCVCAPGYYRNFLGTCITEEECDRCPKKNEFFACDSACDNECINIESQNRTNCPIVNIVCNKKCYCEDGYARDASGNCIPVSQCKKSRCDPNEEYIRTKSCPPDLCISTVAFFKCDSNETPKYQYWCKPGYLREIAGGPCRPTCQCPQMQNSPDCQR